MIKNELIELHQFWYQFQNSSPTPVEFDEEAAIRYARGISDLCSPNLKAGASKAEPQPLEYSDDNEDGAGTPPPVKTRPRKGKEKAKAMASVSASDEEEEPPVRRNATKRKAAAEKVAAPAKGGRKAKTLMRRRTKLSCGRNVNEQGESSLSPLCRLKLTSPLPLPLL